MLQHFRLIMPRRRTQKRLTHCFYYKIKVGSLVALYPAKRIKMKEVNNAIMAI